LFWPYQGFSAIIKPITSRALVSNLQNNIKVIVVVFQSQRRQKRKRSASLPLLTDKWLENNR